VLLVSRRFASQLACECSGPEITRGADLQGDAARGNKSMVRSSRITSDSVANPLGAQDFDSFAYRLRAADFSGMNEAMHALAGHIFVDGAKVSSGRRVHRRQFHTRRYQANAIPQRSSRLPSPGRRPTAARRRRSARQRRYAAPEAQLTVGVLLAKHDSMEIAGLCVEDAFAARHRFGANVLTQKSGVVIRRTEDGICRSNAR